MYVPKTLEELKNLVENTTEETYQLEFKGKDSLDLKKDDNKKEIAKDVSAFANSAGGVIIYGIKEDKTNKPLIKLELEPVDVKKNIKEQFELIINSNISPKIDGIRIHSISSNNSLGFFLVVEIPQSTTVHQN